MLGNSGDPAAAESGSSGGDAGGVGAGFGEEGDRSSAGSRWPRQETLALIKIRTDMDVVFRDSSVKGPLWEEVSRKLAELGYHRSAKKCKEKFENVFKYHKRTKEGRSTKSEGKAYRFFDQLEALDSNQPPLSLLPPPRPQGHQAATLATLLSVAMPTANPSLPISATVAVAATATATATVANTVSFAQNQAQLQNPISTIPQIVAPIGVRSTNSFPSSTLPPQSNTFSISFSTAIPPLNLNPASVPSSSSTSSDEEPERQMKRKRKLVDFFERLRNEVMEKQEEMQRKFLEALEKREYDRMAREEVWRAQEMARMNRERELLVQERAMAAAKDAAIFTFLQKMSEQQILNPPQTLQGNNPAPQVPPAPPPQEPIQQEPPAQPIQPPPPPPPQSALQTTPPLSTPPPPEAHVPPPVQSTGRPKPDNRGENLNFTPNPSSSRWPKAEVEALIKLRTELDLKYQENVPKGPLWEEISGEMLRLGYNRNAKRCKEKWENINKYFKKMKEANKKRPEDSKTCPYFSQLDALYKEKVKTETHLRLEYPMAPVMAQPEQQWPPQPQVQQHRPDQSQLIEGLDSDDDDDNDNDNEEDETGNYELVANKPSSMGTASES